MHKIELRPAPVLNTPDFRRAFGDGLSKKHLEFVALPGAVFDVEMIHPRHDHAIYQVRTAGYAGSRLYIDSRFAVPAVHAPPPRPLPSREELADRMRRLLGHAYVWGGNWSAGVPELLSLYPPAKAIDEAAKILWTLKGVDCSGLLYEASGGATPRNTSDLVRFGEFLPIEGKSVSELCRMLLPLDMAVWPGHVWFVLDAASSIESKSPWGVIQKPLRERLEETCRERKGVNAWREGLSEHFAIKRFAK